nr:hypothetical protein [Candidatus Sigynarchaeota archaeon]
MALPSTKASLGTTSLSRILAGLPLAASSFFTLYLAPWLFTLFFQQSLTGMTLWMVLLLLPCLLLLVPLLKLPAHACGSAQYRHRFRTITGWCLVPLLAVFGLVVQFDFNKSSFLTMSLIDAIIILGIFNAQLDFTNLHEETIPGAAINDAGASTNTSTGVQANNNHVPFTINVLLPGIIIALLAMGHALVLVPVLPLAWFGAAALYFVRSWHLATLTGADAVVAPDAAGTTVAIDSKSRLPKRVFRPDLWLGFFARWLILLGHSVIALYITSERVLPLWGPWAFGVASGLALGLVISVLLGKAGNGIARHTESIRGAIATGGLVIEAVLIWLNWTAFLGWPAIVLLGLFTGTTWTWILDDFSRKSQQRLPWRHDFGQAFWIVVMLVIIGLGAHEMKFLVLDWPSFLWLVPVVIAGLAGLVALFTWLSHVLARHLPPKAIDLPGARVPHLARQVHVARARQRNMTTAAVLAIAIFTLTLCGTFQSLSRAIVHVDLGRIFYDVNGNPVTSLDLAERSARILLYSPFPTATPGNETIRPGKTVRIGAYLYDARAIGNFTTAQARDWIASTMDVYSLGGYVNYTLYPDDILAMRAINNRTRFYIMTFGTSLGEYDCWTVDSPLGNATSTWNATMDTWTLKADDGNEAIGLHRPSDDSTAHIMDLGSTGWADYYAWIWNTRVQAYHATGVAIDEIMWRGYWGTNINNLRDYDSTEDITATCYTWLQRVHVKSLHEIISQAFWDEAQQYQDGIWGELAFRSGGAYGTRVDDRASIIFYEAMDWAGIVENLVSHGDRDRSYIWAAWYNRDDPAALEYCVATYLMGKVNNCTSVAFHPQPTYDGGYPRNLAGYSLDTVRQELAKHPEFFDLELGNALGPMELLAGPGGQYYQRAFENGIVLVNPFHAFVPGFDSTPPPNPSY